MTIDAENLITVNDTLQTPHDITIIYIHAFVMQFDL